MKKNFECPKIIDNMNCIVCKDKANYCIYEIDAIEKQNKELKSENNNIKDSEFALKTVLKSVQKRNHELEKTNKVKVMTWGPAYDYFKKVGIPAGKIKGYDYKGEQYTFSVFLNTLDTFRDPTKIRREYLLFAKQADEFNPDIILSDSDPNALFYANRKKLPNFTISNLVSTINNYETIPKNLRTKDLILPIYLIVLF